MKVLRAVLALCVVLGWVTIAASPAAAGGWAVTLLDPLPDRIEANRTYTVGFWVLQHGSHPYYGGQLDPVGLKLVDAKGAATMFAGVPLREPAHYAAAILVPEPCDWKVYGVQGPFADYLVGTLTVPGGLSVLPMPPPSPVGPDQRPWGAVRPPEVPVDGGRSRFEDPPGALVAPVGAEASTTTVSREQDPGRPIGRIAVIGAVIVATIATGALTLTLTRRRRPRS
jgi:hypothetical protein